MMVQEQARTEKAGASRAALHLVTALIGGIYAWFLITTYAELSTQWSYLGFWYQPPSPLLTGATIGLSALLGMFLPMHSWTIVGFAKWALYFLLFIPSVIIPPQQGILPMGDLIFLLAVIWSSAAAFILLLSDGKPFAKLRLAPRTFWAGVLGVWAVGNVGIFVIFGETLNIVGLEQVYEQRAAATTLGGALMGYVMGTLSGAVNPFLLVAGITRRQPVLIAAGLIGQLLIYSTLAGKVVLGSTLLTIGVFFVFRNGRVMFGRIYAAVLFFAVLGPIVSVYRAGTGVFSNISDLVYMRILALPGVLVGVYSDFFLNYPVTYLSHSLVGRPFSEYPYGMESVGQVIGRYVTPTAAVAEINNYNANFIAADGIAGFGTLGVPLILFLAGLWLWISSRLIGEIDRRIACAVLMPFVVSLADASLFTAILTGGGGMAALLLYLYRSTEEYGKITAPARLKAQSAGNVRGVRVR
ncbi:hypothetical protein [Sphingopyxis fribergensis]|nr:hypothetical protein [Sphingopyxis fribergensis]